MFTTLNALSGIALTASLLFCIGVVGVYVYKSGKFVRGIFFIWLLLAGTIWLIHSAEIIQWKDSNSDPLLYPDARGPFAALMLGWFYGAVVSLVAMGIRLAAAWLKKGTTSTR